MCSEKEKLEIGIDGYVNSWVSLCFKKRHRHDSNKTRLKGSYQWVAEQAVKVYKEEQDELNKKNIDKFNSPERIQEMADRIDEITTWHRRRRKNY